MVRALAAIVAAVLLLGVMMLATASGAQDTPRARALAQLGAGSVGNRIPVEAAGDETRRRKGETDYPGLRIVHGEVTARTSVSGDKPLARAVAAARSVSIMDGYVTAYGVRRSITTDGQVTTVEGRVDGLKIDGRLIGDFTDTQSFDLPDEAGRVVVNRGSIGLRVILNGPVRGYDADTDIQVAVVKARVRGAAAPPPALAPVPTAAPTATPDATREPQRKARKTRLKRRKAPNVRTRLTGSGYAFPVYSEAAATADDWGGPRQIGPHQGNDIFAPFGSPVLAVADGVVEKVGTLPISGNRLWLRTRGGDEFFYAHLSAFSPAAVNGRHVRAGTVLGFVGNTGDAEPTPPHLHFEIHPGGGDAIDPHEILRAWQQQRDVPPGAWLQRVGTDTSERPGALVEVRDFIAGE